MLRSAAAANATLQKREATHGGIIAGLTELLSPKSRTLKDRPHLSTQSQGAKRRFFACLILL